MTQIFTSVGSSLPPTPEMETDIVRATQHIYRRLVDAMSHPGQTWQLIRHPYMSMEQNPNPTWIASVLLTLVDHETTLHVVPYPDSTDLRNVMTRRTRAAEVALSDADFLAADVASFDPETITAMKRGSLDYPDDGATLVLQVKSLSTTEGPSIALSGPGIKGEYIRPLGDLSTGLIAARNEVTHDYPLGIDVIVVDRSGLVMALPRTTSISVRDGGN